VGMRQKQFPPCALETEAWEGQLSKRRKNVPVKRQGVRDRANPIILKTGKVLHLRILYDLVQATGERK
jgi:hypothetical protein